MEFFEPEDKYKTDEDLKRNTRNRTTAFSIFLVLSVLLLVAVQKDFFSFFAKGKIKESCTYYNTYTRIDDDGIEEGKIKKTLEDHRDVFSKIDGYVDSEIKEISSEKTKKRNYAIYLFLESDSTEIEKIPEFICGHKIVIEKK